MIWFVSQWKKITEGDRGAAAGDYGSLKWTYLDPLTGRKPKCLDFEPFKRAIIIKFDSDSRLFKTNGLSHSDTEGCEVKISYLDITS